MIPVGPITVVLGQAVVEDDPAQQGGPASTAVQIQNSSPFVLNVLTVGDPYTIQPRIAQTVPVGGQPIVITAVQQLAGGSPMITIVWLLAGEQPPMQDGPLPSPSNVLPVSGNIDLLLEEEIADFSTPGTALLTLSAFNSYETIAVVLASQSSNVPLCPAVQVVASTHGSGPMFGRASQWQTAQWPLIPPEISPSLFVQLGPFYIPCNVSAGDVVELNYADAMSLDADPYLSPWQVSVFGLGTAYNPSPLRADGRLMPVAAFANAIELSNADPGPLALADPLNGSARVLLRSAACILGNAALPVAANEWQVQATVDGDTITVAQAIAQSNGIWLQSLDIGPEGLLCDPGSEVLGIAVPDAVSSLVASASFDYVF